VARTRPEVDWPAIRAAYEAGARIAALAGEHGVTRQAIEKRAKVGGWTRSGPAFDARRTLGAIERLLAALLEGDDLAAAARRCNLALPELEEWISGDENLEHLVRQAEAKAGAMVRGGSVEVGVIFRAGGAAFLQGVQSLA
jgi:hypothetical protein